MNTTAIENIPLPSLELNDPKIKQLSKLVDNIENEKSMGYNVDKMENEIDDLVFDLYHLQLAL